MRLEWFEGVPLVSGGYCNAGKEAADTLIKANERSRDGADKAALVRIIQDFDKRGELVNSTATGAYSYFRLLKSDPAFPGDTGTDRLIRLFRELERDGLIYRRSVKTPDRKQKEVFTCAPAPAESAPMPPGGASIYAVLDGKREC